MNDQAYFQYQRFAGYDGKFKDNVVMQVSDDGAFSTAAQSQQCPLKTHPPPQ